MIKNVQSSPKEYSKAIHMLVREMADVYRFSGKHTQVAKPNSVKDHIKGLEVLIEEIFKGTKHDKLKHNMIYRSYVHDLGEVIGELNVLEDAVNKEGIRGADKAKCEAIIFNYFITRAYEILKGSEPLKNFKIEVERYRVKLYHTLGNPEAMTKLMSELKSNTKEYNDSDLDVLIQNYKHVEAPENKDYKYYLFKALDLLEGNQYYVRNSKASNRVPEALVQKISNYSMKLCTKLRAMTPRRYSLITRAVITKMEETINNYKVMAKT